MTESLTLLEHAPAPLFKDAPAPDVLARRIWDHISDHPQTHNQSNWVTYTPGCGTTRCVAGWAVYLTTGEDLTVGASYMEAGQQLLGLSDLDTHRLFLHASNRGAVRALEFLAKGDPIDWDQVDAAEECFGCTQPQQIRSVRWV